MADFRKDTNYEDVSRMFDEAEVGICYNRIEDARLRRNGSGYNDPTAYKAIKNLTRSEVDPDYKRFRDLLGCIMRICELADFRLDSRIEVTDLRTGKIWR